MRPTLLAVPNVSEGRDEGRSRRSARRSRTAATRRAAARRALRRRPPPLGVHARRAAARARRRAPAGRASWRVERIDVMGASGGGARTPAAPARRRARRRAARLPRAAERGAACAEALVCGDRIGARAGCAGVPATASSPTAPACAPSCAAAASPARGRLARAARARRASTAPATSAPASAARALRPDFGPARMHPSAGATLVAARPPLVAFNLQLAAPATLGDARAIAALEREGGAGGPARRARDRRALGGGSAQVSMNVERPPRFRSREVVEAVRAHAPVASAELVGLAPRAALDGFPEDVPLQGFRPRAPRDRERTRLLRAWPRPGANARPSTAATPPA